MHKPIPTLSIILLYTMLFLSSCTPFEDKIPNDVLPQDSLSYILEDLLVLEASLGIAKNSGIPSESLSIFYYNKILEKHRVSQNYFERSMKYYGQHPKIIDELYQQIIPRLEKKQLQQKEIKQEKKMQ